MHASSTLDEIAALYHVTISMKRTETIPPLPMNRALMKTLEQAAKGQSVPYEILPSWAGHDAMIMGRHMATAMLLFLALVESVIVPWKRRTKQI